MSKYIMLFLKGMAMGGANVIPGVSGGTIAFITGIYDRLIDALKSFDAEAIKLLLKFKIKELYKHIDGTFLIVLFAGIGVSLVTIAKLLKTLIANGHEIPVWAFFFGLILASVWSVGRTINKWNVSAIGGLIVGTGIAVSISLLGQANENDNFAYLVLCGVVAICSMLLPGLSGSFVLLLMGNYQLIMLDAVTERNISILAPVAIGALAGFVILSHSISYLLKNFKLPTLGTLTGFVLGSLLVIWPWKNEIHLVDEIGTKILKDGKPIVQGYERYLPELAESETIYAVVFAVVGLLMVILLDVFGNKSTQKAENN
ncbi:MAG: DUF368 domain-containing protein [Bacteroidetes bacterium]|nr:DUF368 domain-containing protein [Bacteroidota bacterium]